MVANSMRQEAPSAMATNPGPTSAYRRGLGSLTTLLLALAAVIYLGYHLAIGLEPDDTWNLETPGALAAADQLIEGPGVLYGPFSGRRPLVLIHAPLYYRLTALAAWPLVRGGITPDRAVLIAGRGLALIGHLIGLVGVWALARLDGAPRRAGLWAVLLIVAAPVFGSLPASVRPDTLGVGLQTLGVWLVLRRLRDGSARRWDLPWAAVAFALALGMKQHLIVAPAVSALLLVLAWLRGRERLGPIVAALALGLVVLAGYYGLEQWLTSGQMFQAVFVLPGALRRVNYGGWGQVQAVGFEVAKRSVGLIALGLACLVAAPRSLLGRRLDGSLWVYLIGELALMAVLCLNTNGSWANYAMPAVVFASILIGRAAPRAIETSGSPIRVLAVPLAALVVLAADVRYVAISAQARRDAHAGLRAVLSEPEIARHPASERYFVGRPQYNRLYGRRDLAIDEWLYESFEKLSAAEPRSAWLKRALTEGPVRLVFVPLDEHHERAVVPGVAEPLPALGFEPILQTGRYYVWERRDAPGTDRGS